jgi:hypothetical protein
LGFDNYHGKVTNSNNIYHGDEDSVNFADEKDVLRRKKKRSCGFDGRLITFIKIDLIDFCRVKEASSSKSSSTPLTIIVRKTPKTSARNSEKHF